MYKYDVQHAFSSNKVICMLCYTASAKWQLNQIYKDLILYVLWVYRQKPQSDRTNPARSKTSPSQ